MDKEEFLKIFEENKDRFIPGIYNYCDRWCERCTKTDFCSLYSVEQESLPPERKLDPDSEEFWSHISDMMKIAIEMLKDMAEEQGIDLSEEPDQSEIEKEVKAKEKADTHPLTGISMNYLKTSKEWLNTNRETIAVLSDELQREAELEIDIERTKEKADEIKDYLNVIQWYMLQIPVKIKRAVRQPVFDFFDEEPIQNDQNGSAKVALIGTERSIAAWYGLLSIMSEHEDSILSQLVSLEKIRKGIEEHFPDVHQFVRPGFDE
jgi:hypothetical protein